MNHYRRLSLFVAIILLMGSLGTGSPTQAEQPSLPVQAPAEPVVIRLTVKDRAELDQVAWALDIWQVHYDKGYAIVAVDPQQYQWLSSLGYRLEIDAVRTEKLRHPLSIPGYPCYRTVEETYAALQQLATDHPTLAALLDIGNSWDKATPGGNPGYDVLRLRITNQAIPGPKPTFFLMAEIHAREYATAELAARFAEYLLDRYGTDPEVTFFVDYYNIDLVPMDNPDGRKLAEAGDYWRKNVDSDDGCTDPSSWGTDLNRNYSFKWGCCGGSSGYACDETYRGPAAASEPETQAIQNYVLGIFPDQRGPGDNDPAPADATGLFLTLHSAASLVLWPWGWTGTDAPNGAALQTIGSKLAWYNGYTPQQSNDLYTTDGTTDDWTYGTLGIASFTFELAGEFFQPCSNFEATDWPDNRDSLLYAMKIAKTPYMTAYGPDALNALASPGLVTPGEPVQLSATVNDQHNGNQTIQAAEYYLLPLHDGTPPGDPGTGTSMQPADGSWNSTVETAVASIDTSSLSTGAYILAVRGKDLGNNWGPFGAAFLYVAEPGVSPVIEGYVREATSNLPLDATVTAGSFQAATDPATGFYSMLVISDTYDISAVAADHAPATVTGVRAENYQTVQQDFSLSPICDAFADDVESGNQGWTAQAPWAITTESSHSPTHSWTDSPGGNYGNNRNTSLTSAVMDLSTYTGVTLDFWHIYDTEPGWDFCYVEYSTNGGSTWTTAASYSGYGHNTYTQEEIPLSGLDGQANARIRFRFYSDTNTVANGWHVDDITLSGGGPACQPALAPTAEFSSNSPVTLGEPMLLTNQTAGTEPLTYWWDFGDGLGTSATVDPTYTYLSAGTFTVTLTATNSLGVDSVSHPVVVEPPPCVDVVGVTIGGETSGAPGVYTFTASLEPGNASPPITWAWDNGDSTATSIRTLGEGVYTLVVTATNCTGAVATDSHAIAIEQPRLYFYLPLVVKNP